jgi:prepilin-type N-terminal cleavage/methylation domain-containing protein
MRNAVFRIRHSALRERAGFTLIESLISILVVSVLLVAALNTSGSAWKGQELIAARGLARLLAEELLTEALQQVHADPDQTAVFGLESAEGSSTRTAFDDVDDYDGWQASPPQTKDGTVFSDLAGWQRMVQVHKVHPYDLTLITGTDFGIKRITVTVRYDNVVLAQIVGIRCGQSIPVVGKPTPYEPI